MIVGSTPPSRIAGKVLVYRLLMLRHFRRCCALWLVAQVLLPFTAPFPTCELSDLFGRGHRQEHPAPLRPPSSHVNDNFEFAPPLATTSGRLKLKVVSALDLSNAGKVVLDLSNERLLEAAVGEQDRRHSRATVLRL